MTSKAAPAIAALAAGDAVVVDYLVRRWRRRFDVMTVEQAQVALAMPTSLPQRLRVLRWLKRNPTAWRQPARWDATPYTLTLTEDEKLLARHLVDGRALEDAVKRVDFEEARAAAAVTGLRAFGVLREDALADDLTPFLAGNGFTFHTVKVEGAPAYNVPCVIDFLLLLDEVYPHDRLTIEDACELTHRPLRVRLDQGEVVGTEPKATFLLRGGSCGTNNLFRSEAAARTWLADHPDACTEGAPVEAYHRAMLLMGITLGTIDALRRTPDEYRALVAEGIRRVTKSKKTKKRK